MKVCTKCGIEKAKAEFSKNSGRKDGLQCSCKECVSEHYKENKEKNTARNIAYYKKNSEKILERAREYRKANAKIIAGRAREYRKANAKIIAGRKKTYREENAEKLAVKRREYYKENAEKFLERRREYYKANPEKFSTYSCNRKAMIRKAEGRHTSADIRTVLEGQRGLCANCQTKLFKSGAKKYHVDHIMPLKLGGSNWPENLQCLCPSCNLSKGAKHPDDWAKQNGRLL